jgi:ankyrin repeat protein
MKRSRRPLAGNAADIADLHHMCRQGRLYDVERWAEQGRPLQLAPEAIVKGTRSKTALQIALETGQHSLALLLLKSDYRLDLERYAPLDLALEARRWDLFDLLVEWGADVNDVDVYTLLNTYNIDLYERFRTAGYDLTQRHEMGSILGHSTSNRPLLGFVKRHRSEDAKLQEELNIALSFHAKEGNDKGINLCLWAGADPHAASPNPGRSSFADEGSENDDERSVGWSAIEEATLAGHLNILKRLRPDPSRDDFDLLYQWARDGVTVAFLASVQPPRNLTSILSSHLSSLGVRLPGMWHRSTDTVEAILSCGVRWNETDAKELSHIRSSLLRIDDEYGVKRIVSRLAKPEICAPETYHELFRTPPAQQRLHSLGLAKKPFTEVEKRKVEYARRNEEITRLLTRYDRAELYERVWFQPVQEVAKAYGISGVRLGKVCRTLEVPVPPRGYWARVRSGYAMRKPPLRTLKIPVR